MVWGDVCVPVCAALVWRRRSAHRRPPARALRAGVDILVSNVAISPSTGDLIGTPEKVYDKIMELNVKAPFMLTQLFAPKMVRQSI